jgi:hypothetical protein
MCDRRSEYGSPASGSRYLLQRTFARVLANVTRHAARWWRAIASKKLSRPAGAHPRHSVAASLLSPASGMTRSLPGRDFSLLSDMH